MENTIDERMYIELKEIFRHLDINLYNRIPEKIKKLINEYQSNNYNFEYDKSKRLYEQNISEQTKNFIGLMYYEYWCPEEKKTELEKILIENEKKQDEKYSYDNLFKKSKKQENIKQNNANISTSMIVEKTSFFKKVINRIKDFFGKNK